MRRSLLFLNVGDSGQRWGSVGSQSGLAPQPPLVLAADHFWAVEKRKREGDMDRMH